MSDLQQKESDERCNARKTDGSGHCQHAAGWGTDHVGQGRCKLHGGNTETQEKSIIAELEDAAGHASTALELQLKHLRRQVERGEDIDSGELDRLARTVLDRTGHGKTETQEVTGADGQPLNVTIERSEYGDE